MWNYFHSVILDESKCNGCTHCLRRCPTEAIRVRNRKASIFAEKCIDCGECIRVCPYHAQDAVTDDMCDTQKYEYKIALVPPVVHGQFDVEIGTEKILKAVEMLGFDRVFDISPYNDVVSAITKYYLDKGTIEKPVVSNNCPAILRLIQLKYPDFLKNIVPVLPPMEVAARLIKTRVMEEKGLKFEEVGVFYISPCPAKVTCIKAPVGIDFCYINGAISFRSVYADICRNLKELNDITVDGEYRYSGRGIGWGGIGGISFSIDSENYLAVDGIENVTKIFDELELGKLQDVGFLEAYGCVGGCVGGPLLVENTFIAKRRIRYLSETFLSPPLIEQDEIETLLNTGLLNFTREIEPRKLMSLDTNIKEAIKKEKQIGEILKTLPNIDCGSCGAPSCRAFAEDVVNGIAREEDCAFRLKTINKGRTK